MSRLLKLALTAAIAFVGSLYASNLAPTPWDLLFLVLGATCVPLGLGLVGLTEGLRDVLRGARRAQDIIATLVSILVVLFSARLLLGIFGWH